MPYLVTPRELNPQWVTLHVRQYCRLVADAKLGALLREFMTKYRQFGRLSPKRWRTVSDAFKKLVGDSEGLVKRAKKGGVR